MRNDRAAALARSRAEAGRLGPISVVEITPSRRDFALYASTRREELAIVAALDPQDARERLLANAVALDDAEVAALALWLGDGGVSPELAREVSEAASAPLLRLDYALAANQIYFARLQGFDAVVLPAGELGTAALAELVAVASSLHMASVIEIDEPGELESAQLSRQVVLGVDCGSAGFDQLISRTSIETILQLVPTAPDQAGALRGRVDAAVVIASDPDEIAALVRRGADMR